MLRFTRTYRWELWLLLSVPLATMVVSGAMPLLLAMSCDSGWQFCDGENAHLTLTTTTLLRGAAISFAQTGVLFVLYPRVRRLRLDFLTLAWQYSMVPPAISTAVFLLLFLVSLALIPMSTRSAALLLAVGDGINLTLTLPLILWFLRQASRFSLAHAFFLYLVMQSYNLWPLVRPWTAHLTSSDVGTLITVVTLVSTPIAGTMLAWLLGNFEVWISASRRRAVKWLLALYALSPLLTLADDLVRGDLHEITGVAGLDLTLTVLAVPAVLVVPFAAIYLVRVRHPRPASL